MKEINPLPKVFLRRDEYEVVMDGSINHESREERCDGLINTTDQRIHIRDDARGWPFLYVLGHEVSHSMLCWTGMSAILTGYDSEGNLEEAICDAFGKGIIEFIRENPAVCEYIWSLTKNE